MKWHRTIGSPFGAHRALGTAAPRSRAAMHALVLMTCVSTLSLGGCSESVMIRSAPPDAAVLIDGQRIGLTPTQFTVSRSDLKPYSLRLEKQGYETVADIITPRVAPGRVVGAIFTLGILYLFRSPYYLAAERTYALPPDPRAVEEARKAERDRTIGQTLRNLQDLHERGEISDEELKNRRQRLLAPQSP